jgi:hypothetical protein
MRGHIGVFAALIVTAPSPHSPSKTGVTALMVGEGIADLQQ